MLALSLAVSCGPTHYRVRPIEGDCTKLIQDKLDKCFLKGGGKVTLLPGDYHTGGLRLRSNTTLYLKSGARIIGSRDCADYDILYDDIYERLDSEDSCGRDIVWIRPRDRKNGQAPHIMIAGSRWNDAIIRIYKAHNVAVIGEEGSVIDGCNSFDIEGEEHYRGVHGISAHKSSNLLFKGYQIERTGNWAHLLRNCRDAVFEDLTILGGHDGVHISTCDSIKIVNCTMKTGDDCIAGFDNRHVLVKGCTLNSSCSAFRFGGTDFLAEDCLCYGPGEYIFRGSLKKPAKAAGVDTSSTARRNMLSFFTYYADKTIKVREKPGNIRFKNIECHNIDRFIHYNLSGNETWQLGVPLDRVSFENIHADGLKYPLCIYSVEDCPFSLEMDRCTLSFSVEQDEAVRGGHIDTLILSDINFIGLGDNKPLLRYWTEKLPEIKISGLNGVKPEIVKEQRLFAVKGI